MDSYFFDEDEFLQEEKLDLRRYYRALLKRWWLILLVALLITVPWALYLKSQPPIYEAVALIRFKSYGGIDPSLIESRTTELTSRSFAERVVAQLGLSMRLDKSLQQFKRKEIFAEFSTTRQPVPGQYIFRLNTDNTYTLSQILNEQRETILQRGKISEITENPLTINGFSFKLIHQGLPLPLEVPFKIIQFRKAVESFQNRTRVTMSRSGHVMSVTLTDSDPYLVAEMTNRLAEIFVEESASLKKKSLKSVSSILQEQLNLVKQKLDESDIALKAFKEMNSTTLNADQQTQVKKLLEVESQKQNLETIITTLKDLLTKLEGDQRLSNNKELRKEHNMNRRYIMREIANHSVFDANATMLVYRQRLHDLEELWKNIVSGTSEENYKAKETLEKIYQLHILIEDIAVQEIQKLQIDLKEVEEKIAYLNNQLKQLPTQQYKLSQLTRENNVLEQRYLDLLAKARDAAITEVVETEDIEILDPAIIPEFPTNRDKKQKAALGSVFGFILGLCVALVVEILDKRIKTVIDVKKYLKLKILGSIPQIDFNDVYDFQDSEKIKQIDQQLVTHDYSPTPVGEAYRSLRTSILFSKENNKIQSMVITSIEPGDGKSFTAANLSITFAQLKSNTLLIDGDLRRGVLHNTFSVPKEPGFSNYLTNMVPLQSVFCETQIPNLTLISCGSLIPNPSELLGSHQMQRFLDEVRRKFDMIIFDSPPLNAATDAVVIGTRVDSTVMVIRAGKTDRDLALQKLELFSNVPANILGVILNGTTADLAHPGYSYYHY